MLTQDKKNITLNTTMFNNALNETYFDEFTNFSRICLDENLGCKIDHNIVCVGDPIYCNLTLKEYTNIVYDYIFPTVPEWILIFSHMVVFFMGLIGNALVCIAVYKNPLMRTVTNIFIVNLAVADLFVILFCLPPTVVWDVTETWFLGETLCKVVTYFQTVSVTVSILTLTFIAVDRFYAICFPLRYKPQTAHAWRYIGLIWMFALLFDLPELLVLTTVTKKLRFDIELFTQCTTTWPPEQERTFNIIKMIFLYTLPLIFMSVAYYQIVKVLWRSNNIPGQDDMSSKANNAQSSHLRQCESSSTTSGQLRARRKAAKMLVAVVIMFALCYFPVHALNIIRYTTGLQQSDVISVCSLFSHWLCYANSAVNPLIYNFMSGKFRREFRKVLGLSPCFRHSIRRRFVDKQSEYRSQRSNDDQEHSIIPMTTQSIHLQPSSKKKSGQLRSGV